MTEPEAIPQGLTRVARADVTWEAPAFTGWLRFNPIEIRAWALSHEEVAGVKVWRATPQPHQVVVGVVSKRQMEMNPQQAALSVGTATRLMAEYAMDPMVGAHVIIMPLQIIE